MFADADLEDADVVQADVPPRAQDEVEQLESITLRMDVQGGVGSPLPSAQPAQSKRSRSSSTARAAPSPTLGSSARAPAPFSQLSPPAAYSAGAEGAEPSSREPQSGEEESSSSSSSGGISGAVTAPSASSSSSSAGLGPHSWEMESVVDSRRSNGRQWYHIKWKDFRTVTWEVEETLDLAHPVIRHYHAQQLIASQQQQRDAAAAGGEEVKGGKPEKQEDEDSEDDETREGGSDSGTAAAAAATQGGRRKSKRKASAAAVEMATKKLKSGRAVRAAGGGRRQGKTAQAEREDGKEEEEQRQQGGAAATGADAEGKGTEAAEADDPEYEVEDILSHVLDGGALFYEVKWKGWEKPTWEPADNLDHCAELLTDYNRKKDSKKKRTAAATAGRPAKEKRTGKQTVTQRGSKKQKQQQEQEEEEAEQKSASQGEGKGKETVEAAESKSVEQADGGWPEEEAAEEATTRPRAAPSQERQEHSRSISPQRRNGLSGDGDAAMQDDAAEDSHNGQETRSAVKEKSHKRKTAQTAAVGDGEKDSSRSGQRLRPQHSKHRGAEQEGEGEEEEVQGAAAEAEQEFEVERIVDVDETEGGGVLYEVKWARFPATANTWEPAENLAHCSSLLDDFHAGRRQRGKPKPHQRDADWREGDDRTERAGSTGDNIWQRH